MENRPKILCIIPARGGSKGVPRKNIRLVDGKPLIAYAIEAALASGVITKLVVSTEDKEIADISRKYGAEVVERPMELAGDKVLTEPVMLHALEAVEQSGFQPDFVSLIQCTSPLLSAEVICEAVEKLAKNTNKFDSCGTFYKPETHFNWKHDPETDLFTSEYPVESRPRRQDMIVPYPYVGAGAFYIISTELFKKVKNRWGGNNGRITGVIIPESDALQIDSEEDLSLADQRMKLKKAKLS